MTELSSTILLLTFTPALFSSSARASKSPPLGMPVKQAFCRDSSLAASSLVIYTIRSYRSSTWASCPASLAAKKSDSVVSVYWLFSTVFIIQLNSSTRISAIISGVK